MEGDLVTLPTDEKCAHVYILNLKRKFQYFLPSFDTAYLFLVLAKGKIGLSQYRRGPVLASRSTGKSRLNTCIIGIRLRV